MIVIIIFIMIMYGLLIFPKLDACFARSSPSYETLHGSNLDTDTRHERYRAENMRRLLSGSKQWLQRQKGSAHMRSFAVRRICQKRQLYIASRLATSILCGSNLVTRARIQNLPTRARILIFPKRARIQTFLMFQGAGNLLWCLLKPPAAANRCLPPLPPRLRSLPAVQGIKTPLYHSPPRK